jgi:hypothetical protein
MIHCMTTQERSRTFEDVAYLVSQMIHAERRSGSVSSLVFFYERFAPPNAVRLTTDEQKFFSNAILESFLLSYRNLLDFFSRPKQSKNPHSDSRAVDFGFQRSLVADSDAEFERVSKHLAHLSKLRRNRICNESWNLTSTLFACRKTLTEFFTHCLTHDAAACAFLKPQVDQMINWLNCLGTPEHFICYNHASRSPFMSHQRSARISIPPPASP